MADTATLEKPEIDVVVEDSSAISNLRYQPDTQKLFVQFHSGDKEYPHYNVPPDVFEDFANADSKGKFFHAEIREKYPPTPEQAFRDELKSTLEAAGIDTDEPIRIQMGRDVVFKGTLDNPEINKLSPSRLAILNSALDAAATGAESVTPSESSRGVLNIDVDDQRVLRLEQGQIATNDLAPIRAEQQAQAELDFAESLDSLAGNILDRSGDDLKQLIENKGLSEDFYEDYDGYREAWNATADWVTSEAKTDPALSNFLQEFPDKLQSVPGKLLEKQFDPDYAPQVSTLRQPLEEVLSKPQPEVIESETLVPDPASSIAEAATVSVASSQPPAVVSEPEKKTNAPTAEPEKLTIPAAAVALRELYQSIKEPAKQWANVALSKLQQAASLVPDDLSQRGMETTQKALSAVAKLPEDLRKREMAGAVVKLAKAFGEVQQDGDRKVFGLETEKYSIQVRNTNQYSVTNANGDEILKFAQTRSGPKFSVFSPNAIEQSDLLRAGKQAAPELASQSAETKLAKLGNLAPAGTKATVREEQETQIVDRLNKTMDQAQARGNQVVEGKHYRLEQLEDGSRTLTANGADKPSLTIAADGKISSSLQPKDIERLSAPSPEALHKSRTKQEVER